MSNETSKKRLIKITNPGALRLYGWKDPVPTYVIASGALWQLWFDLHQKEKEK